MKKYLLMASAAIMVVMSSFIFSCDDADEGESWKDWNLRNTINGPEWHTRQFKIGDKLVNWEDAGLIYFSVKFSASNHNFKSEKIVYDENGIGIDEKHEQYGYSDNTGYTIKDNIIDCTVDEKPYFKITLAKKVKETMEGTLYFYNDNSSYEVIMTR